MMSKSLDDLRAELLQSPDVRAAYDAQAPEYALAKAVDAQPRFDAGLSAPGAA